MELWVRDEDCCLILRTGTEQSILSLVKVASNSVLGSSPVIFVVKFPPAVIVDVVVSILLQFLLL